jgi:hypothetical protein
VHCVARLFIQGGVSKCCTRRCRASCAKTVSKLHLLDGRELLFERKQLPQSDVNTRNLREPIETLEKISLLHTQEVTGSSPVAPTIPALANQQLAISTPEHFLLSFSKTYQNRIKTRSAPYHRIKTTKHPPPGSRGFGPMGPASSEKKRYSPTLLKRKVGYHQASEGSYPAVFAD